MKRRKEVARILGSAGFAGKAEGKIRVFPKKKKRQR